MAMGLPVVSTAMSDIPSLLEGAGLVVPPDDAGALAGAIAHLLDHPGEAQKLGAAARRKIVSHFSWKAGAAELGAYFQRVTGKQAAFEAARV
jgi:glycosyltransferase involved in cell wall biosynthesis